MEKNSGQLGAEIGALFLSFVFVVYTTLSVAPFDDEWYGCTSIL